MKNSTVSVGSTDSAQVVFMKPPVKVRVRNALRNNKGFLFVLPSVLLWLFVGLYPVVFSIVLAFHRWTGFSKFTIFPTYNCEPPACRFVGLRNFELFLTYGSPGWTRFFNALTNSFSA